MNDFDLIRKRRYFTEKWKQRLFRSRT